MQNNLEIEVKRSGLTKAMFSKKVGISLMSYYRYAKGERIPDIETVQVMAKELRVNVEDLYPTEKKDRPAQQCGTVRDAK